MQYAPATPPAVLNMTAHPAASFPNLAKTTVYNVLTKLTNSGRLTADISSRIYLYSLPITEAAEVAPEAADAA